MVITIAEAIEAEDAVQLTALLLPKAKPVKPPAKVTRKLCAISLALSAAQERGLTPQVASIVSRGVLRNSKPDADGNTYSQGCELLTKEALFAALDADLAQLTALWNASVPAEYFVSTSENASGGGNSASRDRALLLSTEILRARNALVDLRHDLIQFRAESSFVARRTRDIRAETSVIALDSLESDCSERARVRSSGSSACGAVVARGNAISAKLRLLRGQVAAELYDTAAVSALRVAAQALETRTSTLEPERIRAQNTVARYRAVEAEHPEEFARVVREYRGLMRALDEKMWSLKELGVSSTSP